MNMPAKQKFILVLFGIALLYMLAFVRTIAPSFDLQNELTEMEEEYTSLELASGELMKLKEREEKLTRSLGDVELSTAEVRSTIVDRISTYMEGLELRFVDMPEFHEDERSKYKVYSHPLILEGSYKDLMSLLYYLETEVSELNIASIQFVKVKDKRNRNEKLQLEVLFQNISKI